MNFSHNLFNLKSGEENKDEVLKNIRSSVNFRGANLWILACAIIVASVGLNVNSTAVVIGAMLISPLMGPIVGAGFSLGIHDFTLLRRSLYNLLVATLVSLSVATIYFFISPYKEAQSEILSRTSPNIYDVLIAFFGGLVGVIAVTRTEKGNPIPGVAIATALMPPLCTAGYGLATGNLAYFGGAMFLYLINCTFICLATYAIVKYLDYPLVNFIDKKNAKRVKLFISSLVILLIIPSLYFAYIFLQAQTYRSNIKSFLTSEFEDRGKTVIYQRTTTNKNPKTIELAFLNATFTPKEIDDYNHRLKHYNIKNTQLIIRQDSAFLANKTALIDKENEIMQKNEVIISDLKNQLDKYKVNDANIFAEAKSIFPSLKHFSFAKQKVYISQDSAYLQPVAIYTTDSSFSTSQESKLKEWLKAKMSLDTLQIYKGVSLE